MSTITCRYSFRPGATQRTGAAEIDTQTDLIRFVLDGKVVELDNIDPTRTVLQYLREDLKRSGTKEGCAEGDCGACTVVLAELSRDGEQVVLRAINSCIQFLPTLDGKELITVESLGRDGELHPVQKAMVETHGSQCGFCTPGFVMSLYALYETNPNPTRRDIDDALAGNLCRCTGYRPIIKAARKMYELRRKSDRRLNPDMLRALVRNDGLCVSHGDKIFVAPATVEELADLLASRPEATILAGGTDIGLWVTKQHQELQTVVYTGRVAELNAISVSDSHIEIGAAVPLADAMLIITEHFPGLEELFKRFASPPIRNAGTLGGNIANGSPIGDSMPALMVAGASLVLRRGRSQRELSLDDFYVDYQVSELRTSEFIEAIRIPLPQKGSVLRSHKLSKRFDQDISAVCTAYRLELDGDHVKSFRMACGGLATTVIRASKCEAAIHGRRWDETAIDAGALALAEDFTPISDMRASADYRLRATQNLLRRFFLETRGELTETVYMYGRKD
jgi:xanthine dehydrogenase small subunit